MADFNGDIYVKPHTNSARYGEGEIICDKSIVLKSIAAPANPAATYNKIYVDNVINRLRIRDNAGISRNVGVLYEQHIINANITTNTDSQLLRTFILNGSSKNGIATSWSISYTSNIASTVRLVTATGGVVIAVASLAVATNAIVSVVNFTNYPVNDTVAQLRGFRSANGTVTIHSIKIEY